MEATIAKNGLLLTADDYDLAELAELKLENADCFGSDVVMYEFLETFIANSEFDYLPAEDIGALTDAPIIGTTDEYGNITSGYAFMNYQIVSLQEQLLDTGKAFLEGGTQ